MADTPNVLIIIPTYNRAHYLAEAIDSALQQDYPHKKIAIVDDGSTDSTRQLCENYVNRHPNIVSYHYQKNAGCSTARNRGLAMIDEDTAYVCFLDSDDRLLPGKLSREVMLLEKHPDSGFTYSDAIVHDEVSGIEERQTVAGAKNPGSFALEHFLTNAAKPSAILYRAAVVGNLRFREDLLYNEDSEFLQRVAFDSKGIYSDVPGCWMRWHANSKSRNLVDILKAVLRSNTDLLSSHPEFHQANKAAINNMMEKSRRLLSTRLLLAKRWQEVVEYSDHPFLLMQAKLRFSALQQAREQINLWLNKRHLKHH